MVIFALAVLQRGRLVVTRIIDPPNICQRGLCKSVNSACKVSTVKLASICLLQLKYHSIRYKKSPGNEPAHGEMKMFLRCVSKRFQFPSPAWRFKLIEDLQY